MTHDELTSRLEAFGSRIAEALRRISFLGDVHGKFRHLARALEAAKQPAHWLVFLGDVDVDSKTSRCVSTWRPCTETIPD